MVEFKYATADELFGPLNEVEKKHAPKMLYYAGKAELLRKRPKISIIGSRSASSEGLSLASEVVGLVVSRGGVVVSGLAKGIDTAAHRAACARGGATIAVVGTSLSSCYPRENEALQRELMERQLVVSEFPEGFPTNKKNFVMRNRTMALLSHGSVIIEAGETSGTQHQGREALRLGRKVFMPKALLEAHFDWPKELLGYGALAFASIDELALLLDEYLSGERRLEVGGEAWL